MKRGLIHTISLERSDLKESITFPIFMIKTIKMVFKYVLATKNYVDDSRCECGYDIDHVM